MTTDAMIADLKAAMDYGEAYSCEFVRVHGAALLALLEQRDSERAHADMLAEALRTLHGDLFAREQATTALATHDTRRGK